MAVSNQQPDPYNSDRADHYRVHHNKNLRTRLTSWRELGALKTAMELAGKPSSVLDVPCGTGRFWPVFEQTGVTTLIAGDASLNMLRVAKEYPPDVPEFQIQEMDLFNLTLPDNAVDFISCQRFLHHISIPEERMGVLTGLRRVTGRYLAISLWVDGNLQSRRYLGRTADRTRSGFGRRICRPRTEVEAEFLFAGFRIVHYQDIWPKLAMWRHYLLEVS